MLGALRKPFLGRSSALEDWEMPFAECRYSPVRTKIPRDQLRGEIWSPNLTGFNFLDLLDNSLPIRLLPNGI